MDKPRPVVSDQLLERFLSREDCWEYIGDFQVHHLDLNYPELRFRGRIHPLPELPDSIPPIVGAALRQAIGTGRCS